MSTVSSLCKARETWNIRQDMVDEISPQALAARIKQEMDARGKKQTELAELFGLSANAVSKWIKSGKIGRDRIPVIARFLGVTMEWLLTGREPKTLQDARYIPPVGSVNLSLEPPLTPRDRALLDLFHGLTSEQQDAYLRDLETTQRRNAEIFEALSRQRKST